MSSPPCVRVEPPRVEFREVRVGEVYRTTVTVTNVGGASRDIMLLKPPSKPFKFTFNAPPSSAVAPGLSVGGSLTFSPEQAVEVGDSLEFLIDRLTTIEVQLRAYPSACKLSVDSLVDFGSVAATSQVLVKQLPLTNQGSAPGQYQVKFNGDPSVKLSPSRGTVMPGATQWLTVELSTHKPGLIEEMAVVKLQSSPDRSLRIRAEVVDQALQIYDLQGSPLSCLSFGPVYNGTSRVERVVLKNNGPATCQWLGLLQDTAEGTELATELWKSTDAALLGRRRKALNSNTSHGPDPSQVVCCVPKQGRIGPYEQITVSVRFSPLCKRPVEGKKRPSSAGPEEYAVFLLFQRVDTMHGFTPLNAPTAGHGVELAVTGVGLPVRLLPKPGVDFRFLGCVQGQRSDLLCLLRNLCPQLPVHFRFRKVEQFRAEPASGVVASGQCQDVVLSFIPRQLGSFRVRQKVDVLGYVTDPRAGEAAELRLRPFHTLMLDLSGVCHAQTTYPELMLNPGITPQVTNPSGQHHHVLSNELARCAGRAYTAVLGAATTRLHAHRKGRSKSLEKEEFVAFPNDRASSIRPSSPHREYRTIFTGVRRYRYVDPEYAFTEEEEEDRKRHQQAYLDFISKLKQNRLQKVQERQRREAVEEVDIGLVPAHGLVPPRLLLSDLESNQSTVAKPPRNHGALLSVTGQSGSCQVTERTNAVPLTSQEVADCGRTLSAEELYQVVVSPLTVDFGEVCVSSACLCTLTMTNRLPAHVWLRLRVDPPELQGSSPLSHVLPPCSHATLALVFQSATPGPFHRSVSYTVNNHHQGQVQVQARVVAPALELSSTNLVLGPAPNPGKQSQYRGAVTLRNRGNRAADFTWLPVVTERGLLFSVRPATGTVEAERELDCEVIWIPSFSSPAAGVFDLRVHNGDTQRLHCLAKVASPRVQLSESLVKLGSVPLNMPTVKTVFLVNHGHNPAYFQLLDPCPLPGMVLSPYEGEVPVGGRTPLELHFNPEAVMRFDTRIKIALRNRKSIELRVGGSVEPPNIDISVAEFQFGGVHVGSVHEVPFRVTNCSPAAALVAFHLSESPDFTLRVASPGTSLGPGANTVPLEGLQTVNCGLVFSPTQVAGYDFLLLLTVNGVRWGSCRSASASPPRVFHLPTPPTTSSSRSLSAGPGGPAGRPAAAIVMETGPRRVRATALRAPLEVSPSGLEFRLEPLESQSVVYTQSVELRACRGLSSPAVRWALDCSAVPLGPDGGPPLLEVWPREGSLGPDRSVSLAVSVSDRVVRAVGGRVTRLSLPLFLVGEGEGEGAHLYRELVVTVTTPRPTLTFVPARLLLAPVPLDTVATATLTVWATGYPSWCSVTAEVCEVEGKEGYRSCLSVAFPQGSTFPGAAQDQRSTPLTCCVSFCSSETLSVRSTLVFSDHLGHRFEVDVCAAADCCLLSVWPYLALHRSDQRIVLLRAANVTGVPTDARSGDDSQGPVEAVLQRCQSPSPASCFTSASSTSSFAPYGTPNRTSFSDSHPESQAEGGNSGSRVQEEGSLGQGPPITGALPEFPGPGSEEGLRSQGVLLAAQRWFTLFGWPEGPHPVTIPHTLRRVSAPMVVGGDSRGRCYPVTKSKDSRSVVDMLRHLSSTQPPGIPLDQSLSRDVGARTNQLLEQQRAMLAFLRERGALLAHIRPEYLLDTHEFNHWCSLQVEESEIDYSRVDYESLSKRSWLDVLLQIYKVLVLCRVSGDIDAFQAQEVMGQREVKGHLEVIGHQALGSNVYSSWELRLLAWLNTHYQAMRSRVWSTGELPPARWIVNFDLNLADGLVLAALLASYCPHMVSSHFHRMYTRSISLEQVLHNNIILVQALCALSLNVDVQPTDLSDPNPVQMLMLCVHLFEHLPRLRPLQTVTFSGELHSTVTKQVRLKSPSSKTLQYQCSLLGSDASFFSLPSDSTVTLPPGASAEVSVNFSGSCLRPMEALLLLTCCSAIGPRGGTLAFALKNKLTHLKPTRMVRCTSPCYQLKRIQLPITNPFPTDACFRVLLMEVRCQPVALDDTTIRLFQQASVDGVSPEESGSESRGTEAGEFFSAVKSICLKPGQADTLEVSFLPLSPGTKYCSLLLLCPQVGDMVYSVKAVAELPLSCPLTATPTAQLAPPPDTTDRGEPALGLQCMAGEAFEVTLLVPRVNEARETALGLWAQRGMSPREWRRRRLTHTLDGSSVRTAAALRKATEQQADRIRDAGHSEGLEYGVEVSMPDHFHLPHTVTVPLGEHAGAEREPEWEHVSVPLRFQADTAGCYRCLLVLRSWLDTRVYELDVQVTAQGVHAHLDFSLPAHQSITQDIPLHNETKQAWRLRAVLGGSGFSGPEQLDVPAGEKTSYPLTFRPAVQCVVTGKLSLLNDCDGTEHTFTLRGVGQRPLPVDHVVLHCQVGQVTRTELRVPNFRRHKITLQVVTDLTIASGGTSLEIMPGRTAAYTLAVSPWKRGQTSGSVSFVATENREEPARNPGDVFRPYEVYFSVEISSKPSPPLDILNIQSSVLGSSEAELAVRHPGGGEVDVALEGEGLSGEQRVAAPPRGTLLYGLTFTPGREGRTTGSVVFQSESLGELWYQLELVAVSPPPSTLPPVHCEVGRWVRQTIVLENPTAESLELKVANSNPKNYKLETDGRHIILVAPQSSSVLGVRFRPSFLGDHRARITFSCPQITAWCFLLSGCGFQPVSISSTIGSHASVNIPFSNPTEHPALLSISLSDEDPGGATSGQAVKRDEQVFWVPLRRTQGLRVGAGACLDVPVVFAPETMNPQQAWLYITLQPLLQGPEPHAACHHPDTDSTRPAEIQEGNAASVRWAYAFRGLPGPPPPPESGPPRVVRCQAGGRLEEPLEVRLTGGRDAAGQEGGAVCVDDFQCEVRCDNEEQRPLVDECVAVSVAAACKDPESGVVALTANLVYTPRGPHKCSVFLAVRCVSGAHWTFPLTLVAMEMGIDDCIAVTAAGPGMTSTVGLHLHNPSCGSEFTVTPSCGGLPPRGSGGPLLTGAFTPTTDTKTPRDLLLVQGVDKRWAYEIQETLPDPVHVSPPRSPVSANRNPTAQEAISPANKRSRNYVARNLRLPALANSSPSKVTFQR